MTLPIARSRLLLLLVIAAVAGLAALAMPPLLMEDLGSVQAYGSPRIVWFAKLMAAPHLKVTAALLLVLGIALGAEGSVSPGAAFLAAVTPALVLHTVNFLGDVQVDPTSHNLWPIEYVMFFGPYVCVALGVWIVRLIRDRAAP